MRVLPDDLREILREPLGRLVDETGLLQFLQGEPQVVSVGDRVTYTLLKHGFTPVLCIVDFIIERKFCPDDMKRFIRRFPGRRIMVKNAPGTISDDLWDAIEVAYHHIDTGPICIEVDGEEDLAALPAIFLAPRDVTVIYGLPNRGVVVVPATIPNKHKVKEILDKM
jgi:hypothetical protein